jgi:hypothetical protein
VGPDPGVHHALAATARTAHVADQHEQQLAAIWPAGPRTLPLCAPPLLDTADATSDRTSTKLVSTDITIEDDLTNDAAEPKG